ncbi:MAG: hypothetical protein ABFD46_03795 [Armatimonadota bacterium]
MKRNLVLAAVLLGIFLLVLPSQSAAIFVKADGDDSLNGLSWENAKKTVQAGINAAVSGDQVWVKSGIYIGCITHKSGVGLYGGFLGTDGETVATRNYKTNITVLDGNQAGNVITVPQYASSSTIIDGFTIRNGVEVSSVLGKYSSI